ncbi:MULTISPECIES: YbaB/EbfC family nucleoid-associated protein [Campylobacter]|uniref:Nucleoid-associated protein CSUIS_1590 n=1 Tax=Campylobacter porcelli TaxID=1660073 RepID=A0A1X9SYJ3_9BACT|nr:MULTISPECIES: YbaB/EbfC family nucleoid-associated protein [unclassified Campylobacter]MCR8678752.1 YbaB/EbfC family nucleoid-associated protein [Campylobacter sp. RM19072]MCR8696286.1 YbaB/EbfC family nucleoid-associated protein [Campylobacter sp. RM19073]MEE3704549.1 YbaB/EbfC family nucleoid-associated protein [Campylobacter sp. CX2-8023-23]MEE3744225.1 YbaB/EbfC family nucleoid-associated protein [Campylobacter sp. CX2-4855-23]MEE3776504.1 YbaB/EbfC family nucleoid-associated protein [C
MFKDFDFSKMTQMLSQAQQKADEFQAQLAQKEFCSKSGGGLISVKINGKSEILDISIDDSLLEDKDSLQILLISAINDAINLANEEKQKAASSLLGGFGAFGGGL